MEIIYSCCCGMDVHAKTVVTTLIKDSVKTTRTFSTMTDALLQMSDWLSAEGCACVAMESTGVYWRPVFNLLEGVLEVILVNAHHVKAVPGRKTDVKDSEWLADLLRHGLLRGSFIPPFEVRELRELTRYRQTLVKTQTMLANRVQKVIESGNIKLGQVVTDVFGVSGRLMLRALAAGEDDSEKLASFAKRSLKRKIPELQRALRGRLGDAQRFVLSELLDRYDETEAAIKKVNQQIEREVAKSDHPFEQEIELLETIPGVGQAVAEAIVSEIGVDMRRFPSAKHLASWAGVCPGNHKSAGKRKSGRTNKGNKSLRAALVQAAWGASHTKGTYLAAQYRRMVKRKGSKNGMVLKCVGHRHRFNFCNNKSSL